MPAGGYTSGQILAAALQKADGQVEDTQRFIQALYGLQMDTAKGPVKLNQDHDIVQNIYIYRVVKQGSSVGKETVSTYHDVSLTFARSAEEAAKFPWNDFQGKWAGMTNAQLAQALR